MTKAQARIIVCGLLHDGMDVEKLTPQARAELRTAIDVILALTQCSGSKTGSSGE